MKFFPQKIFVSNYNQSIEGTNLPSLNADGVCSGLCPAYILYDLQGLLPQFFEMIDIFSNINKVTIANIIASINKGGKVVITKDDAVYSWGNLQDFIQLIIDYYKNQNNSSTHALLSKNRVMYVNSWNEKNIYFDNSIKYYRIRSGTHECVIKTDKSGFYFYDPNSNKQLFCKYDDQKDFFNIYLASYASNNNKNYFKIICLSSFSEEQSLTELVDKILLLVGGRKSIKKPLINELSTYRSNITSMMNLCFSLIKFLKKVTKKVKIVDIINEFITKFPDNSKTYRLADQIKEVLNEAAEYMVFLRNQIIYIFTKTGNPEEMFYHFLQSMILENDLHLVQFSLDFARLQKYNFDINLKLSQYVSKSLPLIKVALIEYSASYGKLDAMDLLIANGSVLSRSSKLKEERIECMQYAVVFNQKNVLMHFFQKNIYFNIKDTLYAILLFGKTEILKQLISVGIVGCSRNKLLEMITDLLHGKRNPLRKSIFTYQKETLLPFLLSDLKIKISPKLLYDILMESIANNQIVTFQCIINFDPKLYDEALAITVRDDAWCLTRCLVEKFPQCAVDIHKNLNLAIERRSWKVVITFITYDSNLSPEEKKLLMKSKEEISKNYSNLLEDLKNTQSESLNQYLNLSAPNTFFANLISKDTTRSLLFHNRNDASIGSSNSNEDANLKNEGAVSLLN